MPESSRGDYIIWSFNVSFWYILEVILGMIMVDNGSLSRAVMNLKSLSLSSIGVCKAYHWGMEI